MSIASYRNWTTERQEWLGHDDYNVMSGAGPPIFTSSTAAKSPFDIVGVHDPYIALPAPRSPTSVRIRSGVAETDPMRVPIGTLSEST